MVYSVFWSSMCDNGLCSPHSGCRACLIAQALWILSAILVYQGMYTDVPNKVGLKENIIAAGVDFDRLQKHLDKESAGYHVYSNGALA